MTIAKQMVDALEPCPDCGSLEHKACPPSKRNRTLDRVVADRRQAAKTATHYILASRLWFADRPDSKVYVSDVPRKGSNGRYGDWEYSSNRDRAVLLDITWARRFVTDCLEVGAPVTLEPFPSHWTPVVVKDDRQTHMFQDVEVVEEENPNDHQQD